MPHPGSDESPVVTKRSVRTVDETVSLLTELIKAKG